MYDLTSNYFYKIKNNLVNARTREIVLIGQPRRWLFPSWATMKKNRSLEQKKWQKNITSSLRVLHKEYLFNTIVANRGWYVRSSPIWREICGFRTVALDDGCLLALRIVVLCVKSVLSHYKAIGSKFHINSPNCN